MMYGIIDLGSNTIRLNIYKLEDNKFTLLLSKKETAGLASYIKNGEMNEEGIAKACEVMIEFELLLKHFDITRIYAFATAALRNITNSKKAVDTIVGKSGIPIVVLTGHKEAELDFIGATTTLGVRDGLLIDIGGASTELVIYHDSKIIKTCSMPLGSLNVYNAYVSHLLPSRTERKVIKQAVLTELAKDTDMNYGTYKNICGVGGTIRAAGKLNNYLFKLPSANTEIKTPNIKKMIKLLENDTDDSLISSETLDTLLKVVSDRVMTILPGMIILNTLVKHFKSENIAISNAGVREGYLYYTQILKKSLQNLSEESSLALSDTKETVFLSDTTPAAGQSPENSAENDFTAKEKTVKDESDDAAV